MKKIAALIMAAALLATMAYASEQNASDAAEPVETTASAEPTEEASEDVDENVAADEFGFVEEGYTGEWTAVDELNLEFCLPDGWTADQTQADVVYYAINADNTANLSIYKSADDVDDLAAWAEENLENFETGEASLHDVVIREDAEAKTLYIQFLNSENQVITFQFGYTSEDAISREFALEIAGSAYDTWDDGEMAFDEENPETTDAVDGTENAQVDGGDEAPAEDSAE